MGFRLRGLGSKVSMACLCEVKGSGSSNPMHFLWVLCDHRKGIHILTNIMNCCMYIHTYIPAHVMGVRLRTTSNKHHQATLCRSFTPHTKHHDFRKNNTSLPTNTASIMCFFCSDSPSLDPRLEKCTVTYQRQSGLCRAHEMRTRKHDTAVLAQTADKALAAECKHGRWHHICQQIPEGSRFPSAYTRGAHRTRLSGTVLAFSCVASSCASNQGFVTASLHAPFCCIFRTHCFIMPLHSRVWELGMWGWMSRGVLGLRRTGFGKFRTCV